MASFLDLSSLLQAVERIPVSNLVIDIVPMGDNIQGLVEQERALLFHMDRARADASKTSSGYALGDLERAFDQIVGKVASLSAAVAKLTGAEPLTPNRDPRAIARQRELDRSHNPGSAPAHSVSRASGPPEIPLEELIFDKVKDYLGGGAYGKVYRGVCRGKNVAIKVPLRQQMSEAELQAVRHEVDIMRNIFHPNVVLFLGANTQAGSLMIATELMRTDLDQLIHNNPEFSKVTLSTKIKMAKDAALGLNWLHGICHIIHRDLKPANLLVDKNNTVKVTDFGFSETLMAGRGLLHDMKGPKGTALYMAPEVMKQEGFNEKADVYSFGLILYELLTGEDLFPEYDDLDPFFHAICFDHERPKIPAGTIPSLARLMTSCWAPDPNARPSFKEVLRSLDEILVDCSISDEQGRAFWKAQFLAPRHTLLEEVPWKEFVQRLSASLGEEIDPNVAEKLRPLVATQPSKGEDTVAMERLELLLKWFGNFLQPPHGMHVLREMAEVQRKAWFHGDISKDESERRLRARPDNTFLVRLSLNDPANTPFTISKVRGGKPTHKRVTHLTGVPHDKRYSVPVEGNDLSYPSLIVMVDKLKAINNLGADCPPSELSNPYSND
eukprot:TRINITY_DN2065_c0_g1_i2.p1 TRINITY_DN2065_c0_g1~~TRINITY_DN2065_c0_g1_i2.p1  ORF type:complete len:611 (+),score=151.57 TRINITY_DN2065_c0_g1_i2:48-1880(+)